MSLDFRLGGIKGWEDLCRGGSPTGPLNPVTETLVFATMSAGIGEITEENFVEFYQRMMCCFAISEFGMPSNIPTLQDVKAHIGLKTNVSNEPRTKWIKTRFEGNAMSLRYNLRRDAERAAKELADA